MPTPIKNSSNMRKHLTNSEKESRSGAEAGMTRRTRVTLKMPRWLSAEAQGIWKDIRKKVRGLELLDNLDTEMLGIYCDLNAKYRAASQMLSQGSQFVGEDGKPLIITDEMIKQTQAWARVIVMYAEKLGISPTARARLAKRRAEREQPDELEQLLDDVQGYMDGMDEQVGGSVRAGREGK